MCTSLCGSCGALTGITKAKEHKDITITLRDGKVLSGKAFETTPLSIAEGISKSLAGKVVVAKVNAQLWDLVRPFEEDSRLELLDFDDPEGIFRFVFVFVFN